VESKSKLAVIAITIAIAAFLSCSPASAQGNTDKALARQLHRV